MLSEHCVSFMRPHVEKTFVLAEASRDIVTGFVHIALVNFGELGVVADQQQCRGNTNDRS